MKSEELKSKIDKLLSKLVDFCVRATKKIFFVFLFRFELTRFNMIFLNKRKNMQISK